MVMVYGYMPQRMNWTCALCPEGEGNMNGTLEDVTGHLERVHGMESARWPDGGLVIDMSEVPELMRPL